MRIDRMDHNGLHLINRFYGSIVYCSFLFSIYQECIYSEKKEIKNYYYYKFIYISIITTIITTTSNLYYNCSHFAFNNWVVATIINI